MSLCDLCGGRNKKNIFKIFPHLSFKLVFRLILTVKGNILEDQTLWSVLLQSVWIFETNCSLIIYYEKGDDESKVQQNNIIRCFFMASHIYSNHH